jgi:hypothetical protein
VPADANSLAVLDKGGIIMAESDAEGNGVFPLVPLASGIAGTIVIQTKANSQRGRMMSTHNSEEPLMSDHSCSEKEGRLSPNSS